MTTWTPNFKPFSGLSARANNVLDRLGLTTRAAVAQAIQSGNLHPLPRPNPIRGYGSRTHSETCRWLGMPRECMPKLRRYNNGQLQIVLKCLEKHCAEALAVCEQQHGMQSDDTAVKHLRYILDVLQNLRY